MGMGDVKMLAMIGAFLGWKLTILTLILSSIGGSLAGIVLLVTHRGNMKAAIPFGTFLAAGAFLASLYGDPLVTWYLRHLG
jgi:leader peptidase (prepilin peptidase)/N-methyltransferase